MTNETSLFGEVLTAESEDDRRAICAHAIRAAVQPTRHPFAPSFAAIRATRAS